MPNFHFSSLPPQFPEERPAVSVSPKASHPWISEQMLVVGCTGVNNVSEVFFDRSSAKKCNDLLRQCDSA